MNKLFISKDGVRYTRFCRLLVPVLIFAQLATLPASVGAIEQSQSAGSGTPFAHTELGGKQHPAPVVTRNQPKVNTTVPQNKVLVPDNDFSSDPTDAEFFTKSPFEEPLVPIGVKTTSSDNKALAKALTTLRNRKVQDDFSGVEDFLASHPGSPWRIALLTDLGLMYRKTGWYSKSLSAWEEAWTLGKSVTDVRQKSIVDRALAELIVLNARIGRVERLESLFSEIQGRLIAGSCERRITNAQQGLEWMKRHPELGYRCGPLAVESLRLASTKPIAASALIQTEPSSPKGTNLLQVQQLAQKVGMPLIMAKRTPGAPILTPSIINWKVGHFAAAIGMKNGLIQLHDPTFSYDVLVTPQAIDAESSGYWLVSPQKLPSGWSEVSSVEGANVWGKGPASMVDPNEPTGPTCPICEIIAAVTGTPGANAVPPGNLVGPDSTPANAGSLAMATYSLSQASCSVNVMDSPMAYRPKYGPPVKFEIHYSQAQANQPSVFSYSSVSPSWTFDWLTYIQDNPGVQSLPVTLFASDGSTKTFNYNTKSQTTLYGPEESTQNTIKPSQTPNSYELDMADGSKQIFSTYTGITYPRKIFLTKCIDPTGNTLTFTYDANFRMTSVRDASGLVTSISYVSNSDPTVTTYFLISQVTDPFGRYATLQYDSKTNMLISSTDTSGIKSSYAYSKGENGAYTISSMTTPYGTTTFSTGQTSSLDSFIEVIDPLGGHERTETNLDPTLIPLPSQIPPGVDDTFLTYRNNLYWSKKAMATAPGLISSALITQFRHEPGFTTMSDVVSSVQAPLENRVFYNYAGDDQSNPPYIVTAASDLPSAVKKLDLNNKLQEQDFTYNAVGNVLTSKDELGRITTNVYDPNNNDLIKVMQGSDVIAQYTYYLNHQVHVAIDASGQSTTYTYDPTTFQLKTLTNAKGEVTTYNYTSGLLSTVVGNLGETELSYTYDGFNRVSSVTDVNGYTLTFDYDNLNRLTQITYPDNTTSQNVYTILDITQTKDRQNRWSSFIYNANRLLITGIDPANRYTSYQRCICGELTGLTDASGNQTNWSYDIEGRLLTKTYADKSVETTVYEPTSSRVATFTDAKGQITSSSYNVDDSLNTLTYSNCTVPTPAVSFMYDTVYPRMTSMSDGTGTTTYTYNAPAAIVSSTLGGDRLASETGPLGATATINYSYDVLGRVTGTSVNGVSSTVSFDSLDRVTTATNPLGTFTYGYLGMTPRIQSVGSTNGPTTNYTYETIAANKEIRLAEIQNLTHIGGALSKFDYTYNEVGTISSWQQQTDSSTPTVWNYQYDGADQLLGAVKTNTSTMAVLSTYVYQYDLAGNRTSEQINLGLQSTSNNNLNQVTGHSGAGTLQFAGTLSKPTTVTVGGNPAAVDASNHFTGFAAVVNGINNIPITAKDFSGNTTTNTIQVTEPSGTVGGTPAYDILGNLVNNGSGQTYEWDGKNEMTAINYSGAAVMNNITRTEFTYDGLMRRVRIVEKNSSGTVLSKKQHLWVGNTIAEERDSSDTVQKRFYPQGVQMGTTNYFYTRDHLGSTRELVDSNGTIQARYDYDPYGRVTLIQGTNMADFQFCGYYEHQTSGLNLTKYRAYDPNTGKWINRDPIAEQGGINLYDYCGNNPLNNVDPSGRDLSSVLNYISGALSYLQGTWSVAGGVLVGGSLSLTVNGSGVQLTPSFGFGLGAGGSFTGGANLPVKKGPVPSNWGWNACIAGGANSGEAFPLGWSGGGSWSTAPSGPDTSSFSNFANSLSPQTAAPQNVSAGYGWGLENGVSLGYGYSFNLIKW